MNIEILFFGILLLMIFAVIFIFIIFIICEKYDFKNNVYIIVYKEDMEEEIYKIKRKDVLTAYFYNDQTCFIETKLFIYFFMNKNYNEKGCVIEDFKDIFERKIKNKYVIFMKSVPYIYSKIELKVIEKNINKHGE